MTLPQLLGAVLRDVSRSFFISIRLLPRRLRQPVGLAYILARSTDTIADTPEVPVEERAAALQKLSAAIAGDGPAELGAIQDSFARRQTNEAERKLITLLPESVRMLDLLNAADRADIREVLAKITRGQKLDLERFGHPGTIRPLATASDLNEYTYLVAGCVGEFWTRLCFRYVVNFSRQSEQQMAKLGVEYGKGLQLVNILRDAHADLANGRCYFPEEELSRAGLSAADLPKEPARFQPIYGKWLDSAQGGLEAGMQYALAIDHARVRAATVLPALIGARTIAMLRAAGPAAVQEKVKVPRKEVRGMIATVALTLARREALRAMFDRAHR